MHVLSIGNPEETLRLLLPALTIARADTAEYAEDIEYHLEQGAYDALIVDLDTSLLGVSFVATLRKHGVTLPIIGIGGIMDDGWHNHRARFLELGGDDLLKSPGNPREIVASLHACMRRIHSARVGKVSDLVMVDKDVHVAVEMDTLSRHVSVDGAQVSLTPHEYLIFSTLVKRRDRIVSKEALLTAAYNGRDEPELKIIDVFVCKIRKKFEDFYPGLGDIVKTEWGRGYRYTPESAVSNGQLRKKLGSEAQSKNPIHT